MSWAGIENYHRPKQSVEALALLTTYGDGALIVNGGTFIHGLVARGERDTNLDNFFVSLFCSNMESNEMLKELVVPIPKMRSASAFEKLETNANDLAILNSAVSMEVSGKIYEKITIVIGGGVGETPVRATSAETVLKGQTLTQERVSHAAARAKEDVVPLSDHRASAEYRVAMTEVLVRRCLQRSLERLDIT